MDAAQFWDDRFSGEDYLFGTSPNATVEEICRGLASGRALDLGCGEGRNAVWLAGAGHDVVAVDVSSVALEKAQQLAEATGVAVEWVLADLGLYQPDPHAFDLVLLSYVHVVPAVRQLLHARAVEAMAPEATLVLVGHHLDNLTDGIGGPQSPDVLYTEDQLRRDFDELDIERCEKVYRSVEDQSAIDIVCVATRR